MRIIVSLKADHAKSKYCCYGHGKHIFHQKSSSGRLVHDVMAQEYQPRNKTERSQFLFWAIFPGIDSEKRMRSECSMR